MDNTNPLAEYFRTPGVQQVLPTEGRYLSTPPKTSISGELAILPMTAADEIVLKNPDALLNGDALERLFHSCVPGIANPREISVPDLDVLLLAIKLASYGDVLDINLHCPKCDHEFSTETSIRGILSTITMVKEEDTIVRLNDDLVLQLRPYDFECKTILDMKTFEESKMVEFLVAEDMDEFEKQKKFNKAYERMAELNLDLLARTIVSVQTPKGKVDDKKFIEQFIKNTSRQDIKTISDKLNKISLAGVEREIQAVCPQESCGHTWETSLIFDAAHFFA